MQNKRNSKQVLLAGHRFMPGMHLRQPEFAYSACLQRKNTKTERNRRFTIFLTKRTG